MNELEIMTLTKQQDALATKLRDAGVPGVFAVLVASKHKYNRRGAIDASTVFSPDTQSVSVTSPTAEQWIDVSYLDHGGDKMATWRYASVKLAAAVGRAM